MQINKIDNTNFKAIYKMKVDEKIIQELRTRVIPTYNKVTNQPAVVLQGRNPFVQILDDMIEAFAKQNNASKSWAIMNANNNGIKISEDKDILYIFSGDKDVKNLLSYIEERREYNKPSFINSIKNFFRKKEDRISISAETPKHLIPLALIDKFNQKETVAFNKYLGNKFIEAETPKELLIKMMCER